MDGKVIRRFIEATQNVFGTMLRTSVTFGAPAPTAATPGLGDVSGIIGFSGDVAGAAVIRLPMDTAIGLVRAFTGQPFTPESDDFADAIGELANMICGSAKSIMQNPGVSISCPQVVLGMGHRIHRPSDAVSVTVPCEAPQGTFAIEISIHVAATPAQVGRTRQSAAG